MFGKIYREYTVMIRVRSVSDVRMMARLRFRDAVKCVIFMVMVWV